MPLWQFWAIFWGLFKKKKEFMKKLRFFFLQNGKNSQKKIKSLI
jgi:hypothetical protein